MDALLGVALLIAVPMALRTPPGTAGRGGAALRVARWLAFPAAVPLVASLSDAPGSTGLLLALPWLVAAIVGVAGTVLRFADDPARLRPGPRHAEDLAVLFWLVGALAEIAYRSGIALFGFDPLLIRLAVVHFHVAGVVLVTAGAAAWRRRPARWLEVGLGALLLGIPLTAVGFFGQPLINWAGAMLVVTGGLAVAAAHLRLALRPDPSIPPVATVLFGVAGVGLLVSMPLAAVYATGRTFGPSVLAMDLMIAVHGTLNVLWFAVPAMVGSWATQRNPPAADEPDTELTMGAARDRNGAAAVRLAGFAEGAYVGLGLIALPAVAILLSSIGSDLRLSSIPAALAPILIPVPLAGAVAGAHAARRAVADIDAGRHVTGIGTLALVALVVATPLLSVAGSLAGAAAGPDRLLVVAVRGVIASPGLWILSPFAMPVAWLCAVAWSLRMERRFGLAMTPTPAGPKVPARRSPSPIGNARRSGSA